MSKYSISSRHVFLVRVNRNPRKPAESFSFKQKRKVFSAGKVLKNVKNFRPPFQLLEAFQDFFLLTSGRSTEFGLTPPLQPWSSSGRDFEDNRNISP